MALSLYEAFVPTCQQLLTAMRGIVDKAEAHVQENGLGDAELLDASLAEDMWSTPWHVRACWVHSAFAISLMPSGEFSPDFTDRPASWDEMRAMIDDALARLDLVDPHELEALADNQVFFVLGGKRLMEFKVQDFLMSFSKPNFYFHATTFYDILRMKGVALGKRDYSGIPRMVGMPS